MTNSIQKGKRGEREFRDVLREAGYDDARRGQQYCGGEDSPDIVCKSLSRFHFEVKRVEKLNLENAMRQAITDAGGKIPIVASRKSRGEWLVTMKASDLMRILSDN